MEFVDFFIYSPIYIIWLQYQMIDFFKVPKLSSDEQRSKCFS